MTFPIATLDDALAHRRGGRIILCPNVRQEIFYKNMQIGQI
jgi:hypothetical protein